MNYFIGQLDQNFTIGIHGHAILVHESRVHLEEHGAKVETVQLGRTVQKVCTVRFQVYSSLQSGCKDIGFKKYMELRLMYSAP